MAPLSFFIKICVIEFLYFCMQLDNQKHLRAQPNWPWNYLLYIFQICLSFSGVFDKGNESRISKNYLMYLTLLFFYPIYQNPVHQKIDSFMFLGPRGKIQGLVKWPSAMYISTRHKENITPVDTGCKLNIL